MGSGQPCQNQSYAGYFSKKCYGVIIFKLDLLGINLLKNPGNEQKNGRGKIYWSVKFKILDVWIMKRQGDEKEYD